VQAIEVHRFGGPEVLQIVEISPPLPGPHELLVEVAVAGVNFRDLLQRAGLFGATVPFVPGAEGSGRVLEVGDDVEGFRAGDRVAWKLGPSYAEQVTVPASEAVHVPDSVDDEHAAAVLLQGLTAHALATTVFPIAPGDAALVHAAAGGVGSLLTQIVTQRGGRVIATVSSSAKEKAAREAGADEVLLYDQPGVDSAAAVREHTGGLGADVVFDGVGASTFDASLASCRTRGSVVVYGASSGPVPPIDVMVLMARGSLVLTRPSVRDFTATREELDSRAGELFAALEHGTLSVTISARYPLAEAASAHEELASRRSTGKLLLVP
jgi:NADPH2:quinone reductase